MKNTNQPIAAWKVVGINLVLLSLWSLPAAADTQTLTPIGGDGQAGEIDPYSEGSIDGGATWGPTYYVGMHPWQDSGGAIPGTTTWINTYPSQTQGLYTTSLVRIRFNMPDIFSDATMDLRMKADNRGTIQMNGESLATIEGGNLHIRRFLPGPGVVHPSAWLE